MWRLPTRLALLALLLALRGSALIDLADQIVDHRFDLVSIPVASPEITTSKRLRFVVGWQLKNSDPDFGGLSGLLVAEGGLLAVSDKGALLEVGFAGGRPATARVRPLPSGCALGQFNRQRDTESLARDAKGNVWIGFEWRNAICRIGATLDRATALAVPDQMRGWPKTGGPEAMTRLRDGRTIVLAERSFIGRKETPLLLFSGDPTDPGARAKQQSYRPPLGYRPTDIAELPDGSLLILHRRFRVPFDFATILSILPAPALTGDQPLRARALALLKAPGLNENFEGLAIEERAGRTFVWLVSDDNFASAQKTYLLKFELTGG